MCSRVSLVRRSGVSTGETPNLHEVPVLVTSLVAADRLRNLAYGFASGPGVRLRRPQSVCGFARVLPEGDLQSVSDLSSYCVVVTESENSSANDCEKGAFGSSRIPL